MPNSLPERIKQNTAIATDTRPIMIPIPFPMNIGARETISISMMERNIHAKPKSYSTPLLNSGSVIRSRMTPVAMTPVDMPKM